MLINEKLKKPENQLYIPWNPLPLPGIKIKKYHKKQSITIK